MTNDDKKTINAQPGDLDTEAQDATPDVQDEIDELEDGTDGMPDLDEGMFAQVQEMMEKLGKVDELERENAELKGKLGRLAADFDNYRRRTQQDVQDAQGQGVAKAAEALMPVYDDLDRAVTMGSGDPAKLIPGVQAVQATVLRIFANLGLEATGQEGEAFDPQWHEALQVIPGEQDDVIVQVYQRGFRMGDRLVRPARVVVSKTS
ncbi:nucleotide exchange factor GrpE [Deinococcus maricopensis]|uniref:Protein GrpE n=1 Tax=Deinococcus maricopensis (strain DSM 21211 / LMG 22137 / NRRL B-23946 / LB-34) TaxID=709986 RepID=E8UAS9_DEIML|nr:nucleotide exchange factor GrpE [Deinococcus maricopensis]ADV68168.1 Protein grpE [Deinococcus maricopensis DSM 21211]